MTSKLGRREILQIETKGEGGRKRCETLFRYAEAGRCVSGVVHDINNYLGAIMAYADLVGLEEGLGEEPQRMLGDIHAAVERCTELLSCLATISRGDKPSVNMADAAELMRRILRLRNHKHNVAEINTTFEEDEQLSALVIDLPGIQFALLCLVMNAEDNLMEMEDGPRQLRLSVKKSTDGISFTVWNSGACLTEEEAVRAFKPFTSRHADGHLGLGLFSARETAEAHRGSLTYRAKEGFVMFLPRETGLTL